MLRNQFVSFGNHGISMHLVSKSIALSDRPTNNTKPLM